MQPCAARLLLRPGMPHETPRYLPPLLAQGEIVYLRNNIEQGRARGLRGRLYPYVAMDSPADSVHLLGEAAALAPKLGAPGVSAACLLDGLQGLGLCSCMWFVWASKCTLVATSACQAGHQPRTLGPPAGVYALNVASAPRALGTAVFDTGSAPPGVTFQGDERSAALASGAAPATVLGSQVYDGARVAQVNLVLDGFGPRGLWFGVAPPDMDTTKLVGDPGCGWAVHTSGARRHNGVAVASTGAWARWPLHKLPHADSVRQLAPPCGLRREYAPSAPHLPAPSAPGDHGPYGRLLPLAITIDLAAGVLLVSKEGKPGVIVFSGLKGPLVLAVSLTDHGDCATLVPRPMTYGSIVYDGARRVWLAACSSMCECRVAWVAGVARCGQQLFRMFRTRQVAAC